MEKKLRKLTTEVWIYKNINKSNNEVFNILEQGEKLTSKPYVYIARLYYIDCLKRKEICERTNYSEAHIRQILYEIILMIHIYLLEKT